MYKQGLAENLNLPDDKISVKGPAKVSPTGGLVVDGTGNINTDAELLRGHTYKIVSKKTDDKTRSIEITKVANISELSKVPKDAWLNTDCTGKFGQKDLSEVLNAKALVGVNLSSTRAS